MRKAVVIGLIVLAVLALGVFYLKSDKKRGNVDEAEFVSNITGEQIYDTYYPESVYENRALGISFRYPQNWSPEKNSAKYSGFPEKYSGSDGFFLVKPVENEEKDIMKVVAKEVFQNDKAYGTAPNIESMVLENVELAFILPSPDQADVIKDQALCIVKYPSALDISNKKYQYIYIYTNKLYIRRIFQTVKYLPR